MTDGLENSGVVLAMASEKTGAGTHGSLGGLALLMRIHIGIVMQKKAKDGTDILFGRLQKVLRDNKFECPRVSWCGQSALTW